MGLTILHISCELISVSVVFISASVWSQHTPAAPVLLQCLFPFCTFMESNVLNKRPFQCVKVDFCRSELSAAASEAEKLEGGWVYFLIPQVYQVTTVLSLTPGCYSSRSFSAATVCPPELSAVSQLTGSLFIHNTRVCSSNHVCLYNSGVICFCYPYWC